MKVLVAEDDKFLRKALARFVQTSFPLADIWLAHDGKQAWRKYVSWQPTLVVTDYYMPEWTGEQLAAHIREYKGDTFTPIILISATPEVVKDKTLFTAIIDKIDITEVLDSKFKELFPQHMKGGSECLDGYSEKGNVVQ